jgi:V/A-type H+/Na+-transporting ATPase subunit E
MAEEIKALIEKIQQEGVQAAQAKAEAITEEANIQAKAILAGAKQESDKILNEAQGIISKMQASAQASLKQAARDLLIKLRAEIDAMLEKMIALRVREALSPQELAKIIGRLISDYGAQENGRVIISLNKEDLEKIQKSFMEGLKEEVKKGITLRAAEDISAGLTISFDAGRSSFEFTDYALAEHLAAYLKPSVAELLQGS